MKFSKTLKAEAVLEWTTQYVDYNGLKRKLRAVEKLRDNNKEIGTASETLRNSNEIQDSKYAPGKDHVPKRSSIASNVTDTSSLLSKVSTKLAHWRGNKDIPKHKPSPTVFSSREQLFEQSNSAERAFFLALNQELNKVNLFYDAKEKEALKRFETIKEQYKTLESSKSEKRFTDKDFSNIKDKNNNSIKLNNRISSLSLQIPKKDIIKDAKKRIKKALFELYRGIELLKNYRRLNRIAFIKILKKFDKIKNANASKLYMPKIMKQNFVNSHALNKIIREAEKFYTEHFEEGSRRRAIKKLRMPIKTNDTHYSSAWKIGLYLGMALPFLIYALSLGCSNIQPLYLQSIEKSDDASLILNDSLGNYANDNNTVANIINFEQNRLILLQTYSGIGLILVLALLIGLNMYVWNQARINYKLVFGLNPHDNLDYKQYTEIVSLLFLIFCVTMFLNFGNLFYINVPLILPRVMFGLIVFIVIMPFKIFYYSSRRWFVLTVLRVLGSPFTSVKFREFFIADELTSLSYTCVTWYNYEILYLVPVLSSLPALLRALQCTRRFYDTKKSVHIKNFGKYLSIIISIFMYFNYRNDQYKWKLPWIISQSISSIYTVYWDFNWDWFLFQKNSSNPFLREHLAYKQKWFYYFAIITNFILRWSWIALYITYNDDGNEHLHQPPVAFAVAFGEMLRRWQWNFIRVEHEHILNCKDFRAINETSLPFKTPIEDEIIGNEIGSVVLDVGKDINEGETQIHKSFKANFKDFFTLIRNSRYNQSGYDYEVSNAADQYDYDYDDEEFDEEEEYDRKSSDEEYDNEELEDMYYEEQDYDCAKKIYVVDGENYPRINYRRNLISYASRSIPMFISETPEKD